jgi:hypothetical protein
MAEADQKENWVSMKEASETLKISYYKLIRLVDRGTIPTKEDELDRRARLVNLEDVKRVFRIK